MIFDGTKRLLSLFVFIFISDPATALSKDLTQPQMRRSFFKTAAGGLASTFALMSANSKPALAFMSPGGETVDVKGKATSTNNPSPDTYTNDDIIGRPMPKVAYRSLAIDMPDYGVIVPVAMHYPATSTGLVGADDAGGSSLDHSGVSGRPSITYAHRISVKRIGQLLAGWDFIPDFLAKDFSLTPAMNAMVGDLRVSDFVVAGQEVPFPKSAPVVLLAHGYLGSRFDLSHLAEELAQQGFICLSPEYPESLASSYPRNVGLDRATITNRLLETVENDFGIRATAHGVIGHSLGCGTAISTGDETWTRVCIAGFPSTVDGPALFLSSVNDGAVSLSRLRGSIPSEYVQLDESTIRESMGAQLPRKAALIFDRPDAPNHISFLADSTNDAMINLLSPLLPVAQALSIPVLDFDKYQISRDSKQTAEVVIPLIASYLKQNMM